MPVSAGTTTVDPSRNQSAPANTRTGGEVLRAHAEHAFADELASLAAQDDRPRQAR